MGPFVFQVPVRPRLASVDDASGERRTPSSRTKRRKRFPLSTGRAKAMCLSAARRLDRALHLPPIDPKPAVAAVCITVLQSRRPRFGRLESSMTCNYSGELPLSASRVNF